MAAHRRDRLTDAQGGLGRAVLLPGLPPHHESGLGPCGACERPTGGVVEPSGEVSSDQLRRRGGVPWQEPQDHHVHQIGGGVARGECLVAPSFAGVSGFVSEYCIFLTIGIRKCSQADLL